MRCFLGGKLKYLIGLATLLLVACSDVAPQISLLSKGKLKPLVISGPDISVGNKDKEFTWSLTYDKTQTVFLTEDHIDVVTTGDVTCASKKLIQDGESRKVTIGGCQGDGDVRFSVAAGSAVNVFKEEMEAVHSAVTAKVDNTPPMVVLLKRTPLTSGNSQVVFEWTATYVGADEILLSLAKVQLVPIGGSAVNCDLDLQPSSQGANIKILRSSQCNGEGRYKIAIHSETAKDQAGNLILIGTESEEILIDNTKPTLSVAGPSSQQGNFNKVFEWTVTYAGHDSIALTDSGISLTYSGSVSGCKKEIQTIDGNTQKIKVSECAGDGNVQVKIAEGAAKDSADNRTVEKDDLSVAVVDNTAPTVTIGAVTPPQGNSATSFSWVVTYSGASSVNLNASHINLSGGAFSGGGCNISVTDVVGVTQRTVKVDGCQGSGELGISILPNSATDIAGNFSFAANSASKAMVDNSLFIGTLGTTALAVNSLSSIPITLSFGDTPLSPVSTTHFNLVNATISGFAGSGANYSFDLIPTGDGVVSVQLKSGVVMNPSSTANAASNTLSFTVDRVAPTVSIGAANISTGNSTKTFSWPVSYTAANQVMLTPADVVLSGALAGCVTSISGSGSSARTVSVYGCTGNGNLSFSIKKDTAKDDAGNFALASSVAPTVVVDNIAPVLTVTGPNPSTGNQTTNFIWSLDYSGSNTISLSTSHIILIGDGSSGCTKTIFTKSATQKELRLTNCQSAGSLNFKVVAGSAEDSAGNITAENLSSSQATVYTDVLDFLNPAMNGFGGLKGVPFKVDTQFWIGATSQKFKVYKDLGGGGYSSVTSEQSSIQNLLSYLASYSLEEGAQYFIRTSGTVGALTKTDDTVAWTARYCPEGYVRVPGSPSPATDFCVAKYEMKNVSSKAVSVDAGTPWTGVSRSQAISACRALNLNSYESKFDLISNVQWQTIAEDVSKKAENWSSGSYLIGLLRSGYTYGPAYSSPLAARANDALGCQNNGTENCVVDTGARNRTHTLSNGNVIWDFSGNAWEWVSTLSIGRISGPGAGTGTSTNTHDEMRSFFKTDYSPLETSLGSSSGIGVVYNAGANDGNGVIRGGQVSDGPGAGVFAANINIDENSSHLNTGFRCVYNP